MNATPTLFDLDLAAAELLEPPAPRRPTPAPVPRISAQKYAALQSATFERDGWTCQRCRQHVHPHAGDFADPLVATADHVVPLALGGWHDVVNTQTLCDACNKWKAARILDFRTDIPLRLALVAERERRGMLPKIDRSTVAQTASITAAVRMTPNEALALESRFGSVTFGTRVAIEKLLYDS
jgi:hypothetical protein